MSESLTPTSGGTTEPAPAADAAAAGPRVALRGSHRTRVAGLTGVEPADPAATADITLVLRRRAELPERLVSGRATVSRDAGRV